MIIRMPGQLISDDEKNVIECSDIDGTNAYCDAAAKQELRRRFLPFGYEGVHILGSGNYHYLSLLWTEKIGEDYALLLIDHHPDCQQSAFSDITSCGGWVREALETQEHLKHVYMVGVDDVLLSEVLDAARDEADTTDEKAGMASHMHWYESITKGEPDELETLPLYLSIDTDALSSEYAACDWDQGDMTMDDLTAILKYLSKKHRILGIDICGDKKDPTDAEYELNLTARKEILDAISFSLPC